MFEPKFLGTTKISEKGQVVIPAEVRNNLELESGDTLVVLSGPMGKGILLMKPDFFDKALQDMSKRFESLKNINDEINKG